MLRRRTVLQRMRDDAGAVAIFVALSISTFLLGFAALAVDLGQVYLRKGDLQAIADNAALSGAALLPDVEEASAEAVRTVCLHAPAVPGWTRENLDLGCDDLFSDPVPEWAEYGGDPDDGGLVFYDGDPGDDGIYDAGNQVPFNAAEATAMRVVLPSERVQFGLAGALGADHLTLGAAATARIGSALGAGLLPFAITTKDLTQDNRWCVKDPAVTGPATTTYPGPRPGWLTSPFITVDPLQIARGDVGREIVVRRLPFWSGFPGNAEVYFGGARVPAGDVTIGGSTIRFLAPPIPAAAQKVDVWVQWRTAFGTQYVSNLWTIDVIGPPQADPCDRPEAVRGYVNFDRDPIIADGEDELAENIRDGVQQPVHRYPEDGGGIPLVEGQLGAALNGVVCSVLNPLVGPALGLLNAVVANAITPYVNCAEVHERNFAAQTEDALIDDDGLLTRQCSTAAMVGTRSENIDGTSLFTGNSPLVRANTGGGAALRDAIEDLDAPQEGWIKNEALACPRLVAMPVIHADVPAENKDGAQYPIVDIMYGWIDDGTDGLVYQGNRFQALRGHVIDPGYFPEIVTKSPVVGEYLGDYLPKQAVLVRDVSDID